MPRFFPAATVAAKPALSLRRLSSSTLLSSTPLVGTLLVAMLSLGACAATPPAGAPPATAGCNADAAQSAVGRKATAQLVEQARKDAGAEVVRTLKPGQVVTMEFREGRLNVAVDERNVVIAVRCG